MEGVKVVSDHRVYFRSDFDFRLHLKDCRGEDVGWPDCDWVATFRTRRSPFPVVASVRGGVAENCWNDGGVIHVVADGHRLLPGVLEMEFVALVPDESYPDGRRSVGAVCALDIELTRESDLCVEDVEVEAMLPCLKGDPLRYEDLTDEQRRDLMTPVMEMLAEELSPVLGERTSVESDEEFEARTGFTREDMKKDLFIDLWNAACGKYGRYNKETGYFELNGITDITYEEAIKIYATYNGEYRQNYATLAVQGDAYSPFARVRTLLPIKAWVTGIDTTNACAYSNSLEVLCFHSTRDYDAITISGGTFHYCSKLKEVIGNPLKLGNAPNFKGLKSLENIRLVLTTISVDFSESPLLSIGSISYMVYNSKNTTAITITVHPDVYAKLTDEGNAEWYQVLMDAAERNIQFATV